MTRSIVVVHTAVPEQTVLGTLNETVPEVKVPIVEVGPSVVLHFTLKIFCPVITGTSNARKSPTSVLSGETLVRGVIALKSVLVLEYLHSAVLFVKTPKV